MNTISIKVTICLFVGFILGTFLNCNFPPTNKKNVTSALLTISIFFFIFYFFLRCDNSHYHLITGDDVIGTWVSTTKTDLSTTRVILDLYENGEYAIAGEITGERLTMLSTTEKGRYELCLDAIHLHPTECKRMDINRGALVVYQCVGTAIFRRHGDNLEHDGLVFEKQ